ncbi:hypothetical protein [Runella zeae]|uniref:hypothetical protein n=1 Tax=Runella zeae TaxID=94255 RepID=UPI002353CCAE|nr:hypothetical protein [Runella zeae]
MLNDLKINYDPCDRGLGGLVSMQFLPRAAVDTMAIPSSLSFAGPLTLKAGWRWYELELQHNTAFYNEQYRKTANGGLYDISVGGFYPRDDVATLELLEKMTTYYFLIRAKDYQGRWRLIGNLTETMKFQKRDYQSTTPDTRVGFALEFSGSFQRPGFFDVRV